MIYETMENKNKYTVLFSNTALISIGTFASKLLTFLMVRFYTGVLTPEEYGTADLIMQTANLLIPVISLGVLEGVFRFAMDSAQDPGRIFSAGALAILAGSALLIAAAMLLSALGTLPKSMWLIVPYAIFSCVHSLCAQFIRAKGKTALFAGQGILNTALVIGFNILFLVALRFGVTGYVLSVAFADLVCTLFLLLKEHLWRELTGHIGKSVFRQLLRYSIPLIPTTIFWWITSVSDRYMVAAFLGNEADGIYAVAYKLPTMVALISSVFLEAWQFSAVHELSGNEGEHIQFYEVVWASFQAGMLFAGSIMIALSKPLIHLLAAKEYYAAWEFVPVLTIAMVFSAFVSFMGSVYLVKKKSNLSFWTAMAGAFVNLLLNFLLIPRLGVQGAAIATLASYLVSLLLRMESVKQLLPFHMHQGKLAMGALTIAVQTAAAVIPTAISVAAQMICPAILIFIYHRSLAGALQKILHDRKGDRK